MATATISSTKSIASLKIFPTSSGQTLDLTGSADLDTSAVLHAGSNDFTIRNVGGTGGFVSAAAAARYVHVQQAALAMNVPVTGPAALVKSGDGTLILGAAANGYTGPTTINAGNLRVAGNASLGAGTLEFRGGVLELAGGGTFNRHLDQGQGSAGTPGLVSWNAVGPALGQTSETDRGSGGFAAIGANAVVDLNGLGATDINWEEPSFLTSGYALILGSKNATARVELIDNYGFGLAVDSYNTREIRVVDNPASTADVSRISGIIYSDTPANGGRLHDLVKSGDGVLELTGNNTYYGGTIIAEGTIVAGHNNALGNASAPYVLLGNRGGSAAASLLANAGITVARDITVQAGSAGAVTLGGNNITGVATFSGNITLNKATNFTAAAGGTVAFSGVIGDGATPGAVTKTGAGTVTVSANNTYTGGTTVSAGTLIATNGFKGGGPMTIAAGAKAVVSEATSNTYDPPTTYPSGDNAVHSKVSSLTISGTGVLDVGNSDMVIDYTGASPLDDIKAYLAAGFNGGGWDGTGGITTNTLNANNPEPLDASTFGLGYAENDGSLPTHYGDGTTDPLFFDIAVDDTTVMLKFTWVGDLNLDGFVDFQDLSVFNTNYDNGASSGRYWFEGDFNYDGFIDFQDLSLFNTNYDPSKPSLPEPGTMSMLGVFVLYLGRRRRRCA